MSHPFSSASIWCRVNLAEVAFVFSQQICSSQQVV
jgi:hypothetical protein